ncbi:MAG: 1-acyl-sn-glycerol-3-phosphate acyltransferase, partial [Syntrophaceae bacterium]|nr:1-acyl-sn-glycerol-3-phosphate acyltransferase [Syntrophaceae bacterium]
LNALLLREIARRQGLPIALWTLGEDAPLAGFSEAVRFQNGKQEITVEILKQDSAVLHLGSSRRVNDAAVEEALKEVVHLQEESPRPVFIVPLLISYGRRRDIQDESLFNILFGQYDDVGKVRRIITLLRYAKKITVIPAEPLNLHAYLEENDGLASEDLPMRLRGELIDRIDEEREITVGPILKSRREFIDVILQDREFNKYLQNIAETEKKPMPAMVKEASRYLNEIAADYSETFVEIWDKVLTWLWKNIYDGVIIDRKGMARVRRISRQMPLVVVPCHRSHIDYLLLSYVFYKENIQLPFVAAGINLSFWPIGYIFRKSGAFFIRRSFKGLDLYSEVFSRYVKAMMDERMPIEFFIEGGRSRTGKMVMPKFGLLSMILKAYHDRGEGNLGIIPVYIGYDRVVEEKSYIKELEGVAKAGEKASDVIRSRKVVKKRYGHVYVNVGEPILVRDYLERQGFELNALDERERQALYRKISYEIALAINRVSVVTPSSLAAAAFLAHDRKGIRHNLWKAAIDAFRDYLAYCQAPFSITFERDVSAVEKAVELFMRDQMITVVNAEKATDFEGGRTYNLESEKRLIMDYYKNMIVHYFIPISFIGLSALAGDEKENMLVGLSDDYVFLKKLFRHEFIFDDDTPVDVEIRDGLAYLEERGYIEYEAGRVKKATFELTAGGREMLTAFAGLLQAYLESYWLVTRSVTLLEHQGQEEKEWLREIRHLGLKYYQNGEIRRYESLSQQNFQGAIRFLTETGLISKMEKETRSIYQPCGEPEMLEDISRRIFRYLF